MEEMRSQAGLKTMHSLLTEEQIECSEFLSPGMQAGYIRHRVSMDASRAERMKGATPALGVRGQGGVAGMTADGQPSPSQPRASHFCTLGEATLGCDLAPAGMFYARGQKLSCTGHQSVTSHSARSTTYSASCGNDGPGI